ncbi:unnamed protein product, partial [Iphiclides podalirius]
MMDTTSVPIGSVIPFAINLTKAQAVRTKVAGDAGANVILLEGRRATNHPYCPLIPQQWGGGRAVDSGWLIPPAD